MLLSIIIPCYNSERFVAKTVDMLISQDMADCELILVNDGSTDRTLSILQHYERRYPFVRVIDQANAGVSVARNVGLNAATGKYVYFLDSDDTLIDGTLDYFRQILSSHVSCQMFAFGYETRRNGRINKSYRYKQFSNQELAGKVLAQNFLHKKFCANICSSIYERSFLADKLLRFKQGLRVGEDILFLLRSMINADYVFYSDRLTFIYQIRDDSATGGYKTYAKDLFSCFLTRREILRDECSNDPILLKYLHFFLAGTYLSHFFHYLLSEEKYIEVNELFIANKHILNASMKTPNLFYSLTIQFAKLIPFRLILQFKH